MVVESGHTNIAYSAVFGPSRALQLASAALSFLEEEAVICVGFLVVIEIGGGYFAWRSGIGEEVNSDCHSEGNGPRVDVNRGKVLIW